MPTLDYGPTSTHLIRQAEADSENSAIQATRQEQTILSTTSLLGHARSPQDPSQVEPLPASLYDAFVVSQKASGEIRTSAAAHAAEFRKQVKGTARDKGVLPTNVVGTVMCRGMCHRFVRDAAYSCYKDVCAVGAMIRKVKDANKCAVHSIVYFNSG